MEDTPAQTAVFAHHASTVTRIEQQMPATLSLLLQVTPPARKAQAIAGWSAATGAAGALGNLGGGLILQWLPWQGLFLLFGPLALLLAVAVIRIAPRGERHPANLDPIGAVLLPAAVFALLFGIIEGPEHGWRSGLVLASPSPDPGTP